MASGERDAWMLYGANGYTGRLIAQHAVEAGERPILAGRNAESLTELGRELGCSTRVFALEKPHEIANELRDCRAVLNCAGPFSKTAEPLMLACLRAEVHYLDITGEIPVIERAAQLQVDAESSGVALIPSVGFDVVPTDCLAAQLASRISAPTHLELAFHANGQISPGTAKTVVEGMADGGRARIDGRITRVPLGWKTREIPFREGPQWATTIPWGDVAAAYYSTGIANIETYAAMPQKILRWLPWVRPLAPLARPAFVQQALKRLITQRIAGPTAAERERGRMSIWGRVRNRQGDAAEATMTTPDGYALTVLTALAAVMRVLDRPPLPGFSTPSRAFGSDFIEQFPGVDLEFHPSSAA